MPSIAFTARTISGLRPSATQVDYWDDRLPGFGLRVSPGGRKTWILWYRVRGRGRRLTLGTHLALSLADARGHAREALREVSLGHDPATDRRAAPRADTVDALAAEYLERHAKPNKRTWKEDDRILRSEVLPRWRHQAVADIRRRDVRELVEAIADRGAPVMANRVLALVRKMFNFAVEREWLEANPAGMVRRPSPERRRDRVLTEQEIRTFWKAVEKEPPTVAAAFQLRLVTAQRGGEVVNMRWEEVDLQMPYRRRPCGEDRGQQSPSARAAHRELTAVACLAHR